MRNRFISQPNLPQSDVTAVIVSSQSKALIRSLEHQGITVLETEAEPSIQNSTAHHADILALHLGDNKIALARSQKMLASKLINLGFIVEQYEIGSCYPKDCRLNSLIINNKLIIGKKNDLFNDIQKSIVSLTKNIKVSQGYVRCSTAVVSSNAVISADLTIKKACEQLEIKCLTIPPGEIFLDGYQYGFVGGCCFKKNEETLAFTGKVSLLSSFNKIKAFCDEQNVKIIELTSENLFDIGGVIPILA